MSIIILGFMIACAIFANADGIRLVRCKSTHRYWNSPACSMRTENPDNEMMCTSADVFAEVGGYFSLEDSTVPLCITYILKSTYELGSGEDVFPKGIWLFRSAIYDSSLKTCEQVCSFVRSTTVGTNYTNLYVSCSRDNDGNDEYVDQIWDSQTPYDCSTDNKYKNNTKPTTTPPTTLSTATPTRSTGSTGSTKSTGSTGSTGSTWTSAATSMSTTSKQTTPTPLPPDEPKATLYVGIAEGVVGAIGTAFIVTTNVVLFLQLKKLRGGNSV